MKDKRPLSGRAVVSLLVVWAFLISGITGLVLYIEPHGRVAYWTNWCFLGLGKNQWDGIHVISSWLFVLVGALHLYFNWKPFLGHLRTKVFRNIRLRGELIIASAVALFIVLSGIWGLPPLRYVLDLNEHIKNSWVKTDNDNPPFGHAEMLSLRSLSRKMEIDLEPALAMLQQRGIDVSSTDETIAAIAEKNGITPAEVYEIINRFENHGRDLGDRRKRKFKRAHRRMRDELY